MEFHYRNGFDGTQAAPAAGRNGPTRAQQLQLYVLRAATVVLTFVAAAAMGVARESVTVILTDPNTGQSEKATGSVDSTHFSAFSFFIVANVLALFYSLVSFVISIAKRKDLTKIVLPLSIADLLMVAILFASNGAAAAITVVADHGRPRLGWDKICDVVDEFCGRVKAAVVLSLLSSSAFLLLVLFAILGLRRRSL